jgi:uncharacterized membrane protein
MQIKNFEDDTYERQKIYYTENFREMYTVDRTLDTTLITLSTLGIGFVSSIGNTVMVNITVGLLILLVINQLLVFAYNRRILINEVKFEKRKKRKDRATQISKFLGWSRNTLFIMALISFCVNRVL